MEVLIKLGETTFRSLDKEDEPCVQEPEEGYSYSEVLTKPDLNHT
jgi:hypothetical protein